MCGRACDLGEGRQIYFVGALDKTSPSSGVVGWRDDLTKADPETYAPFSRVSRYCQVPTSGGMKDGTFDVEQAVALKPDVM